MNVECAAASVRRAQLVSARMVQLIAWENATVHVCSTIATYAPETGHLVYTVLTVRLIVLDSAMVRTSRTNAVCATATIPHVRRDFVKKVLLIALESAMACPLKMNVEFATAMVQRVLSAAIVGMESLTVRVFVMEVRRRTSVEHVVAMVQSASSTLRA